MITLQINAKLFIYRALSVLDLISISFTYQRIPNNIRDYRLMYHYLKVVSMSYLNTDEYYIYYKTNAYNAFVPLQSI
jgi:hypothetical protein